MWSIQHADGRRWRTLDPIGMADWTEDPDLALAFSRREHANIFASDDPEDVRIIERNFRDERIAELTPPPVASGEITQEEWDAWPNCSIPGCLNKSCRALRSDKCHPHTRIVELERVLLNMTRRCRDAGWNKALLAEAEDALSSQRPEPDTLQVQGAPVEPL